MPTIISIEGNIGAGKTTLINQLAEELIKNNTKVIIAPEPIEQWTNIYVLGSSTGQFNILEAMYENPKKYCFPFQIWADYTKEKTYKKAIESADDDTIVLLERTLETNKEIFTRSHLAEGFINNELFDIYSILHENTLKTANINYRLIVYANTTPTKCIERIKKRGRQGEEKVNIDYIKKLQDLTLKWLNEPDTKRKTLFCNTEFSFNENDYIQEIQATAARIQLQHIQKRYEEKQLHPIEKEEFEKQLKKIRETIQIQNQRYKEIFTDSNMQKINQMF